MNYQDLHSIEGLHFMPVKDNKQPIVKGWQTSSEKQDMTNCAAVGLVCGMLSGNLEVIDIDAKYDLTGDLFERYKRLVHFADEHLLSKLVVQKTRGGGYHLLYRCVAIAGNIKLANRPTTHEEKKFTFDEEYKALLAKSVGEDEAKAKAQKAADSDKVRVLFETRGQGGFIMCFPSKGYELIYGDFYSIKEITHEEREVLHAIARQFNEVVEEYIVPVKSRATKGKGLSPFDDYNERGDVVALLESYGWKIVDQKGRKTILLRPGQTTSQSSGNFDHDKNWFSVFTTSTEFEPEKAYLPYAVFAVLECNKNFSDAARRLLDMGYGERDEPKKEAESTRVIKSRIVVDDEDYSFLASGQDYDGYLESVRDGTLIQGRTTGIPSLDEHFRFKDGNLVMTNGHDNAGKALSLDTPIPTPKGWSTMGDLKVGDDLFDETGNICKVIAHTGIQTGTDCYRVEFSNGESVICSKEHLWSVRALKGGKNGYNSETILSTEEMINIGIKSVFKQKTLGNFTIQLSAPIVLPDRYRFIINPYTLGAWLGDGISIRNRIVSGKTDMREMANLIRQDGYDTNLVVQKSGNSEIQIQNAFFVTRLRCLNLYNNKHIPDEYLRSSVGERLELLRGLMDTDGYVDVNGRMEFCNQNKKLIDGVLELLSSLGIKYSISVKTPSINGVKMKKVAYYVQFSCSSEKFVVFKLNRKVLRMTKERVRGTTIQITDIVKVHSVPTKCIQVSSKSQLFLCGKTMIPTHNSVVMWYLALLSALYHDWYWVIFSSENTLGAFMRKMIQFYWGLPLAGKYQMTEGQYKKAKSYIEDHFLLIKSEEDMFNYKDIINMMKKTMKKKKLHAGMIDPYNSLKIDLSGFSKLSTHEYHYEALSELKLFGKKTGLGLFVNHHAVTAALRAKDGEKKYPIAPQKADTEGGGKVANKADDFLTIHRVTQHPTEYMITEIHVRKIKDTETGGRVTPIDSPVKLEMYNNGCSFIERKEEGGHCVDPIAAWHDTDGTKQTILTVSAESGRSCWTPYKDENGQEVNF